MPKLTIDDFSLTTLMDGSGQTWLSYKTNQFKICLEPCLSGYDVGLYDLQNSLLIPKVCTNIANFGLKHRGDALYKAVRIANRLQHKFKLLVKP